MWIRAEGETLVNSDDDVKVEASKDRHKLFLHLVGGGTETSWGDLDELGRGLQRTIPANPGFYVPYDRVYDNIDAWLEALREEKRKDELWAAERAANIAAS